MNKCIVLMGCSATGKSTRVYQFIKYCTDVLQWETEDFYYQNKPFGLILKPINLLILGKIVKPFKTSSKEKWQGFDTMTKIFDGSENISVFMKDLIQEYSYLIEGASVFDSFRFRPRFIKEELGIEDYHVWSYTYPKDKPETYNNRVIQRSGKEPPTGANWTKNRSFVKMINKSKEELEEHGLDPEVWNKFINHSYDVPVTQLGEDIFRIFKKEDLIPEFISWSKEKNYALEFQFDNFNENKEETSFSLFGET